MKLTTSLAAIATLSTALAAPTATLVDRNNGNWMSNAPLVTWTVTKFLVVNNTDNLSSNFGFFIEDSYNNTTPCYIPNVYPTGTSLNAHCISMPDNSQASGSPIPYSINWIYEPNTDQGIMELYSNNTAAVFLYPKASHMLQSGLALDDNGPNAVQTLPDGAADVWPTSQAGPATASSTIQAVSPPALSTTQASSSPVASDVSQVVSAANEVVSEASSVASGVIADATNIAASITSMALGSTSTIASVVSSVVSEGDNVVSSVGADASSVVADASSMEASMASTAMSVPAPTTTS